MKKIFVERNKEDDYLDALSHHINKLLKTEKDISDKKSNVYFWIVKFILFLIYIKLIGLIFDGLAIGGVNLIYYFSISLRSIFSALYVSIISFAKTLLILYMSYKNLSIFMNSSYYKRLYSKDKDMKKKKGTIFNIAYNILKYLSIAHLIVLGVLSGIISLMIVLLIVLFVKTKAYSIGISTFLIVSLIISVCLYKEIYNKFFGVGKGINRKLFICLFILLIATVSVFGIETRNYSYKEILPDFFDSTTKEISFDIKDLNKIVLKTNTRYDNVKIYADDSLTDEIKVLFTYSETARPYYVNYIENDKLLLTFDSYFLPKLGTIEDLLRLSCDTIKNKTIYNYNMLKYPEISVYVNSKIKDKIEIDKGNAVDYDYFRQYEI